MRQPGLLATLTQAQLLRLDDLMRAAMMRRQPYRRGDGLLEDIETVRHEIYVALDARCPQ